MLGNSQFLAYAFIRSICLFHNLLRILRTVFSLPDERMSVKLAVAKHRWHCLRYTNLCVCVCVCVCVWFFPLFHVILTLCLNCVAFSRLLLFLRPVTTLACIRSEVTGWDLTAFNSQSMKNNELIENSLERPRKSATEKQVQQRPRALERTAAHISMHGHGFTHTHMHAHMHIILYKATNTVMKYASVFSQLSECKWTPLNLSVSLSVSLSLYLSIYPPLSLSQQPRLVYHGSLTANLNQLVAGSWEWGSVKSSFEIYLYLRFSRPWTFRVCTVIQRGNYFRWFSHSNMYLPNLSIISKMSLKVKFQPNDKLTSAPYKSFPWKAYEDIVRIPENSIGSILLTLSKPNSNINGSQQVTIELRIFKLK